MNHAPAASQPSLPVVKILVSALAFIPGAYLFARLSPSLPAAVGDDLAFPEAWELSKGNGMRLFILIILLPPACPIRMIYLGPCASHQPPIFSSAWYRFSS